MAQEAVEGASRPYPLDIRGELSPNLSRGLWLIKWLLAIPHYVVLIVLGLVSFVLWIIAFWAVLITARYPRGIFNFNVGVLRWGWRVSFYAIAPPRHGSLPAVQPRRGRRLPRRPARTVPGAPLAPQGAVQVVAASDTALCDPGVLRG